MSAKRRKPYRRKRSDSQGVHRRLGRPTKDATEPLIMPLTRRDIDRAQGKRHDYEVDDPENFGECVLATCVAKVAGAEVLIMRKHAYVALPDDEFTLRYTISPRSREFVHMNDEKRFDEIPRNVNVELLPPSPQRRLAAMRASYKNGKGQHQAGTARRQRPSDPYRGIWRNGVFSTER